MIYLRIYDVFVVLQRDLQKEQQRMREMELLGEQQKKVMKVKMEEMSLIQRKLRSGAQSSYSRWLVVSWLS